LPKGGGGGILQGGKGDFSGGAAAERYRGKVSGTS